MPERFGRRGARAANQDVGVFQIRDAGLCGAAGLCGRLGVEPSVLKALCAPPPPYDIFRRALAARQRLLRPHHHARRQHCPISDQAACADHAFLKELRARADLCARGDHAAAQLGAFHNVRTSKQHAALEARAGHNLAAGADAAVLADACAAMHNGTRGDERGVRYDAAVLEPRATRTRRESGKRDSAVQRVPMYAQVGRRVAHVAPVALGDAAVERLAVAQHGGEELMPKIAGLPLRDAGEHLRLQNIHAGIDQIGINIAAPGLFMESGNASVAVGHDHAVFLRRMRSDQQQRGFCTVRFVEGYGGAQVEITHAIAGEHDEALIQKIARLADAASGAQRRAFNIIAKLCAEIGAIAEIIAYAVRHIAQRGADLRYAVLFEQFNGKLHQRPVQQTQHRLGTGTGERAQARALAARHDDGFHEYSSHPPRFSPPRGFHMRAPRQRCARCGGEPYFFRHGRLLCRMCC